jgi:hypothetical protein
MTLSDRNRQQHQAIGSRDPIFARPSPVLEQMRVRFLSHQSLFTNEPPNSEPHLLSRRSLTVAPRPKCLPSARSRLLLYFVTDPVNVMFHIRGIRRSGGGAGACRARGLRYQNSRRIREGHRFHPKQVLAACDRRNIRPRGAAHPNCSSMWRDIDWFAVHHSCAAARNDLWIRRSECIEMVSPVLPEPQRSDKHWILTWNFL